MPNNSVIGFPSLEAVFYAQNQLKCGYTDLQMINSKDTFSEFTMRASFEHHDHRAVSERWWASQEHSIRPLQQKNVLGEPYPVPFSSS
jgi:hypothetical protein